MRDNLIFVTVPPCCRRGRAAPLLASGSTRTLAGGQRWASFAFAPNAMQPSCHGTARAAPVAVPSLRAPGPPAPLGAGGPFCPRSIVGPERGTGPSIKHHPDTLNAAMAGTHFEAASGRYAPDSRDRNMDAIGRLAQALGHRGEMPCKGKVICFKAVAQNRWAAYRRASVSDRVRCARLVQQRATARG